MLTESHGDKIHALSRNLANAAEFLNDTIGSTPSDEMNQERLELMRDLTHTIKTDLRGIDLIIRNTSAAPTKEPQHLQVDRAQIAGGSGPRPNLKAV
ncbi:hypothetical protein [Nesterenkonia jeotgali]|uniref:Uncharacterized protein n=1 Tax=Nesterenkonia jeotgali TaxID=317018 RepID=A0A839FR61_9MICC|nr:hypothetical protein [Nesterenkonia jeotgali]MBA8920423.1 hypothetical protein [Nesterenkonia jeotgali]